MRSKPSQAMMVECCLVCLQIKHHRARCRRLKAKDHVEYESLQSTVVSQNLEELGLYDRLQSKSILKYKGYDVTSVAHDPLRILPNANANATPKVVVYPKKVPQTGLTTTPSPLNSPINNYRIAHLLLLPQSQCLLTVTKQQHQQSQSTQHRS